MEGGAERWSRRGLENGREGLRSETIGMEVATMRRASWWKRDSGQPGKRGSPKRVTRATSGRAGRVVEAKDRATGTEPKPKACDEGNLEARGTCGGKCGAVEVAGCVADALGQPGRGRRRKLPGSREGTGREGLRSGTERNGRRAGRSAVWMRSLERATGQPGARGGVRKDSVERGRGRAPEGCLPSGRCPADAHLRVGVQRMLTFGWVFGECSPSGGCSGRVDAACQGLRWKLGRSVERRGVREPPGNWRGAGARSV
jgi:hypothetical protein